MAYKTLYQALVAAGCKVDNHYSDLYVLATPQASAILTEFSAEYSVFISQVDGERWYDIPFAYDPYWETRATKPA